MTLSAPAWRRLTFWTVASVVLGFAMGQATSDATGLRPVEGPEFLFIAGREFGRYWVAGAVSIYIMDKLPSRSPWLRGVIAFIGFAIAIWAYEMLFGSYTRAGVEGPRGIAARVRGNPRMTREESGAPAIGSRYRRDSLWRLHVAV